MTMTKTMKTTIGSVSYQLGQRYVLTILGREEEEVYGLCRVCDQCNQLCDQFNQLCVSSVQWMMGIVV